MLARGEFGKISSSAEHRFNIAVSVRLFDNIFHIAVNTAVMGKIAFNVVLCLFIWNTDILCKWKCADSVNNTEVNRLCTASHNRSYHIKRHIEHLWRCDCVDIFVILERFNHIFVTRNMGKHTEFNLRIVGVNERPALSCTEKLSHLSAKLGSYGDILEIRLCWADSACSCFGLIEIWMDSAVICNDL